MVCWLGAPQPGQEGGGVNSRSSAEGAEGGGSSVVGAAAGCSAVGLGHVEVRNRGCTTQQSRRAVARRASGSCPAGGIRHRRAARANIGGGGWMN